MEYKNFSTPLSVTKQLQEECGWANTSAKTYKYFNKKYFKPVTNNRTEIIRRFKYLIPGRIFTFDYDPLYKDELDFYDKRPVMLCLKAYKHKGTKNNLQMGINLNFIPAEMRIFILEGVWKIFKQIIERELKERDPTVENVGRIKLLFPKNYDVFEVLDYILEIVGKTNWKFAIRQYIWERIDNAKWIDWEDWGLIPLLHSKDLVGVSERKLIKLYWKDKNRRK